MILAQLIPDTIHFVTLPSAEVVRVFLLVGAIGLVILAIDPWLNKKIDK